MLDETTASVFEERPTHTRCLAITVLAHPHLDRIGDWAWLDAAALQAGIGRTAPSFSSLRGPGGPLEIRQVSRSPVLLAWRTAGLWIAEHPSVEIAGAVVTSGTLVHLHALEQGVRLRLSGCILLHLRLIGDTRTQPLPALGGHSPTALTLHRAIRSLARLDGPVLVTGPATRVDQVCRSLHHEGAHAAGPLIELGLAAFVDAPALERRLHGDPGGALAEAARGTLWLRSLQTLSARGAAIVQAIVGEQTGVRILGTAPHRDAIDPDLAGCFLDHLDLTTELPLPEEDVASHFGAALCARLLQLGREDLVRREPTWMPVDTVISALACAFPAGVESVTALARQVALVSPDAEAIVPHPDPTPVDPRQALLEQLQANDYRIAATADALGISPNTLRKRMHDVGLKTAGELGDPEIRDAMAGCDGDPVAAAALLGVSVHGLRLRITSM